MAAQVGLDDDYPGDLHLPATPSREGHSPWGHPSAQQTLLSSLCPLLAQATGTLSQPDVLHILTLGQVKSRASLVKSCRAWGWGEGTGSAYEVGVGGAS